MTKVIKVSTVKSLHRQCSRSWKKRLKRWVLRRLRKTRSWDVAPCFIPTSTTRKYCWS